LFLEQQMKIYFVMLVLCALMFGVDNGYGDIAFLANINGNWDLFVTDDNGKNRIQLTDTAYDEKDPSWSKDRKNIVYAASDGQLNIINLQTKKIDLIAETRLKTSKISPSFSPDGRMIAFAQFRPPEQGDDTDLMSYDLETRKISRIIDQYAIQMWPVWSPGGNRMVYANMHCSGECGRVIQELWIIDPREKWSRQLLLTHSFCQHPVWSKDGRKIAFSSDKSGNYDIWVVDLASWHLKQITADEGLDVKPAWSADGKKLAFVSMRSGFMEIWIKNLETGRVKRLRPFGNRNVECRGVAW
jgi:TolB protein